jgi:hypothetical protein
VNGSDLPGAQLDREGGRKLGRYPVADCEFVLWLPSKPVLHPLGFRLVRQRRNEQRGITYIRKRDFSRKPSLTRACRCLTALADIAVKCSEKTAGGLAIAADSRLSPAPTTKKQQNGG